MKANPIVDKGSSINHVVKILGIFAPPPLRGQFLGRRLADPTVRGALRGKNHSKQRPLMGPKAPPNCIPH